MSSFAINGRIVFDPHEGPTALAHAVPSSLDGSPESRRRGVNTCGDPRVQVLELVAALALEIRARGHDITALEVE